MLKISFFYFLKLFVWLNVIYLFPKYPEFTSSQHEITERWNKVKLGGRMIYEYFYANFVKRFWLFTKFSENVAIWFQRYIWHGFKFVQWIIVNDSNTKMRVIAETSGFLIFRTSQWNWNMKRMLSGMSQFKWYKMVQSVEATKISLQLPYNILKKLIWSMVSLYILFHFWDTGKAQQKL